MFVNEHKTTVYLYDLYTSRYIKVFRNLDEALEYTFVSLPFGYTKHTITDIDINMNGNDKYNVFNWDCDMHEFYIRRYMYFDSDFRIIDIRVYEKDFKKRYEKKKCINGKIDWNLLHYNELLKKNYFWSKTSCFYHFRNGTVPGTSQHLGDYWRHVRTFSEIRANSVPEYSDFVRGRRKHLPTVYDDKPRNIEKSWKRQSKKRKQWM